VELLVDQHEVALRSSRQNVLILGSLVHPLLE
jgi:hypothetical protein